MLLDSGRNSHEKSNGIEKAVSGTWIMLSGIENFKKFVERNSLLLCFLDKEHKICANQKTTQLYFPHFSSKSCPVTAALFLHFKKDKNPRKQPDKKLGGFLVHTVQKMKHLMKGNNGKKYGSVTF